MTWDRLLIIFVLGLFGFAGWLTFSDLRAFEKSHLLTQLYLPSPLSNAHSFLESQCTACHTPKEGVSSVGCISCHANNKGLLQRQSTAFHANVTSCKECHQEHRGGAKPPLVMNHMALAKIGVRAQGSPHETPSLSALNCVSCHATRDKHQSLFGTSCLSCHTTDSWKIAEYRHPSPNSRQCAQCHQAPPSHYMMHFEMVSKKVAGIEHANVNQCFLCHQTTSWNDIKGVGWYKHH